MVRSTRVELVVGVAARQLLMLARLPFRHDRMVWSRRQEVYLHGPLARRHLRAFAVPPQRDWSLRDGSNVQPCACRAGALPLSYAGRWYRDKDLNLASLLQRQLSYR